MCDTVITWAKENFMFISLIVGVIGVVIAFISLVYEIKKKKKGNKWSWKGKAYEKEDDTDAGAVGVCCGLSGSDDKEQQPVGDGSAW